MIFIDACFGKKTPYTPVWMMRQAGRYLPEYMRVRAEAGDFLSLCKDPKRACEVTLQPVDILGVDAAILFSDILVVPMEMGMALRFEKGEGPVFDAPLETKAQLEALHVEEAAERLEYVYEAIGLIRAQLAPEKALIGFCGAPWTLATYMIEGKGTKTYALCKKLLYSDPEFMHAILRKVTEVLKLYMSRQIEAGVDAVQVFDSWAAALEEPAFFEFSWSYMKELAAYLKAKYPHIPVILFPKGISGYLDKIDGEFDVFGVDWSTPIELAKEKLGHKYVLQGNMEPTRLYSKEAIDGGIEHIASVMQNERHIFNLGHGILPDIPVEHAKYFIKRVQERTKG
ncbi:uroporphyrinogen decarboxylase [Sulfurospirillum sp. T05]|uniref:Uroporphyrinogen decarboxylase n=1 Tax=Sulfurospirillum tamanense TaxID=2813362 RepID=A0ABS2WPB6_9BACT|nr:uroporphyrinogen decarboxylase [Sulfurospirillum tamanensis]MBN2963484.1 uroporphyrinogen decarboxylase [Sulfurospirillum tamanensis]